MSNIFSLLNMTSQSMMASQVGVSVTSHNIANVDTPGYSRQTPLYNNRTDVLGKGGILLGAGVNVSGVRAVESRFLNNQINTSTFNMGKMGVLARGSDLMQEIFNEVDEGGISGRFSNFFDSLQSLANHPEGQAERNSVLSSAQSLVQQFNRASERIQDVREAMDQEVRYSVSEVNRLSTEIAFLNKKIAEVEGSGQTANDFRNNRAALLEELAVHIDFHEFEDDLGMVTVYISSGLPIVSEGTANSLATVNNGLDNSMAEIQFKDSNGNRTDITDRIEGGKLAGALHIRDTQALDMAERLDELAYGLVEQFNAIHSGGYGLDHSTGTNFFMPLAGPEGASRLIAINPEIEQNINKIAAAQVDEEGDNRNALVLAGLQTDLTMNGGTWTFSDYYAAMVGDVGHAANEDIVSYNHQTGITEQLMAYRESVVGVSLEEEMANLIKYQSSYQAAAKLMNSVSELIDILMSLR